MQTVPEKELGGPTGLCLFRRCPHSGSMVTGEHSKLSSERPGWELVLGKGQRYSSWTLTSVVHSGLATEKGRARRGMGKTDRLVDVPAMGGWGIIRMSGWVGGCGCPRARTCAPVCQASISSHIQIPTHLRATYSLVGTQPHAWLCLCSRSLGLQCDLV